LGGLTLDQLRWIFSSYTALELEATGWNPDSLANSDGDDATHLWSELSADCPELEIKIAGPDSESGTYEYFSETIFGDMDNGETFHPTRYLEDSDDNVLVEYLQSNEDAIAYFGFAYYSENTDTLHATAIENDEGEMVAPDATSVGNGRYVETVT